MSEMKWIPIIDTLPPLGEYILLSFSNFSVPVIGRYEEDDEGGGNFYAGDEDVTLISQYMFVNAWMELPKPYKDDQSTDVLNIVKEEAMKDDTGNS